MTSVAIVDDHSVVRLGIKSVLKIGGDLKLVAEGASAADAVEIARSSRPDVLLLDVRMPGVDGIAALKEILRENPAQKVVMLTTSVTEEDVFQSIKAGARGYVPKEAEPEELVAAIRAVAAGRDAFPDGIRKIFELRKESRDLSPREREVVEAVAKGLSNAEIGEAFGVSSNSIKMHLKHIFEKLDVVDRAEAVATAIRRGIIHG